MSWSAAPATSPTQNLFLSNTVHTYRRLREAGIEAELQVFGDLSHAQCLFNETARETKETLTEIAAFFGKHRAKQTIRQRYHKGQTIVKAACANLA